LFNCASGSGFRAAGQGGYPDRERLEDSSFGEASYANRCFEAIAWLGFGSLRAYRARLS